MNTEAPGVRAGGRTASYDIARGIAVVLVIFMHVTMGLSSRMSSPAAIDAFNWAIAAGRMPLVFMVSGVVARGYLHRDLDAVVGRAGNSLWLLVVWSAANAAYGCLFLDLHGAPLSTLGGNILPQQSILWFISALTLLTLTIPIVRMAPPALVVGLAALAAMVTRIPHLGDFASLTVTKGTNHAVYFYVSLLYADRLTRFLAGHAWTKVAMLAPALAVLHLLDRACSGSIGLAALGAPTRVVVCLIALLVAGRLAATPLGAPLQWLGQRTLTIYVAQFFVILPFLRLELRGDFALVAIAGTAATVAGTVVLERALRAIGASWMYRRPALASPAWVKAGIVGALPARAG